jgi:hypothetical protein
MGFAFPLHKFVSGETGSLYHETFRFHVIFKFKGCIVIKSSIYGKLFLIIFVSGDDLISRNLSQTIY